jgi:hypothetical protein
MRVQVHGIGLTGPGLSSWVQAQAILRGAPHVFSPTVVAPPPRLPAAERRRADPSIKLALNVADEAVAQVSVDPHHLPTVFASSGGEGSNCHSLCEILASRERLVSPTRFTNSVQNAAAGYWHIAVASQAPSTSICAFDGSFAAGLLEAATQAHFEDQPLLLVATDSPYPKPLHAVRSLPERFGVALILTGGTGSAALATLDIELAGADAAVNRCADASLEALRGSIPAAAALPLLQAIARRTAEAIVLDYLPALKLRVAVGA